MPTARLVAIKLQVEGTGDPETLFGKSETTQTRTRRRLLAALHPDVWALAPQEDRDEAASLLAKVNEIWERLQKRANSRFEVTSRHYTYTVNGLIERGEYANLYRCTYVDVHQAPPVVAKGVLKLPRRPQDSDLLVREAKSLRKIAELGDPRAAFVSTLVETFRHRDVATKIDRQCNVFVGYEGFHSLAAVAAAFPNGLDARDVVWMWRRGYMALTVAHEAEIVHGAVLPEHVYIHPEEHGLILANFGYSVDLGDPIKAIVSSRRAMYPGEVLAKEPADYSTDIYMLSRTMMTLFNDHTPTQIRNFAKGTCHSLQKGRPDNAGQLLKALTDLIERLYGPRKFRLFTMPTTSRSTP